MQTKSLWAVAAISIAISVFCPSAVEAQRGHDFIRQDANLEGGTHGFPGLADTNLAAKGTFVLDLYGFVDYGVTDNFTLGINAYTLIPNLFGVPAGGIHARYKLYSSSTTRSVLDFKGGGFATDSVYGGGGLFSSNTSIIRPWGTVTLTLSLLRVGTRESQYNETLQQELTESEASTGLGGILSYEHFFSRKIGVQVLLGGIPLVADEVNSVGATSTTTRVNDLTESSIGRLLVHFRLRRWLLSPGILALLADLQEPILWFNASLRL